MFFSGSPALLSKINYSFILSEMAGAWENLEAGKQKKKKDFYNILMHQMKRKKEIQEII